MTGWYEASRGRAELAGAGVETLLASAAAVDLVSGCGAIGPVATRFVWVTEDCAALTVGAEVADAATAASAAPAAIAFGPTADWR